MNSEDIRLASLDRAIAALSNLALNPIEITEAAKIFEAYITGAPRPRNRVEQDAA